MKQTLNVDNTQENLRLDLFLALNISSMSRSEIKKIIENNEVKVNKTVEYKANYKVKMGDTVEIDINKGSDDLADTVKPENIPIETVYEDDDLVVVDKPYGMVVHPATGNTHGTLVNALLYKYKNLKDVGERVRSGLINRIDKDTSGIVFVGKTNRGLWFYSRQFANRYVKKEYIAVAKGDFSKIVDQKHVYKLSTYMDRNPVKRKKFAVVKEGKGRLAITGFKLIGLSKDKKFSLVRAYPETGRTHQIRVHLAYLGYPIVGDPVYGGAVHERLLLHSYRAKLNLLSGEPLVCLSKIKDSYKKFLLENFNKKLIEGIIQSKK